MPNNNSIRYKAGIVTAITDYIPNNGGADKRFSRGGQKENRFDFRKFSVGVRNGLFKFKIRGISKAPKNKIGSDFLAKIHRHAFVGHHLDLGFVLKSIFDELGALFQGEHVFFVGIDSNGNDQFIKQGYAPFDDVIMA